MSAVTEPESDDPRKVEARLRQLERQLVHSERLASMGQLAAGVAHEVNNPAAFVSSNLAILAGHLDNLQAGLTAIRETLVETPEAEAVDGVIKRLHLEEAIADAQAIVAENLEGMSRISAIVRDLRTFARIERDRVELVHLNQVVNAACNIANNQLRHRATLIKDLGEVPAIAADPGKLTQVLLNLLINAAQAIPEGAASSHSVRVRTRVEGDRVVLSVIDSGVGIPEELQGRLFEPFFTTKAEEGGTGLGLVLSAEIVRQHGGDMRVFSSPGKGSRFDVVLPLHTGLKLVAVKTPELPAVVATTPLRILAIDDEANLLKAYRRVLSPPHELVTCNDGLEALDLLREDQAFDVVICDLMMPQLDGPRFFEALAEVAPRLLSRVIFASGGAFTARTKDFVASMSTPCLEKPVPPAELLAAVGRVGARIPTLAPSG